MRKIITVIVFSVLISGVSIGQISFSPAITFVNTIHAGDALLIEDLDDDGDLDVVSSKDGSANLGAGIMLVAENGGENFSVGEIEYSLSTGFQYSIGQTPSYLYPHFGDYDGDGDSDFVVYANGCCQGGTDYGDWVIMESIPDLNFQQIISELSPFNSRYYLTPYDFNNDGVKDAIRRANGVNSAVWNIIISSGELEELNVWDEVFFTSYDYPVTRNLFVLEDINFDGIVDCLAFGQSLYFYPGQAEGYFSQIPFQLYSDDFDSFAVGDWNNDGQKDIITSNNSTFGIIEHFSGNTFYEWQELENTSAYNSTNNSDNPIILNDFDGDGFQDLLIRDNNRLQIILNENGVLGEAIVLSNDINPSTIQIVDLNGDQLMDVVCYNGNGAIVYFLNSSQLGGCTDITSCNFNPNALEDNGSCEYPPYPYDCDLNCLNDADQNGICDEFEQAAPFNPDANGDGVINLLDMLEIFPLYGQPFEVVPCIGGE